MFLLSLQLAVVAVNQESSRGLDLLSCDLPVDAIVCRRRYGRVASRHVLQCGCRSADNLWNTYTPVSVVQPVEFVVVCLRQVSR